MLLPLVPKGFCSRMVAFGGVPPLTRVCRLVGSQAETSISRDEKIGLSLQRFD